MYSNDIDDIKVEVKKIISSNKSSRLYKVFNKLPLNVRDRIVLSVSYKLLRQASKSGQLSLKSDNVLALVDRDVQLEVRNRRIERRLQKSIKPSKKGKVTKKYNANAQRKHVIVRVRDRLLSNADELKIQMSLTRDKTELKRLIDQYNKNEAIYQALARRYPQLK